MSEYPGTNADKTRWHKEDQEDVQAIAKNDISKVGSASLTVQQKGMRAVADDAEYDQKHPVEAAHELARQRRQAKTAAKYK
jgi:hypothetical protein